ncbi:MAG: NYN domain-containing protein [Thermoproteota archaeon]|nr:NYN domain-containing protein [Thermoproteota archaeon]
MSNFLYVDNSNVWIEGMHVSAVKEGIAPDIWAAFQHRICDYNWKMDFGKLYEFAGGQSSEVGRSVLYGSRPPANDSLWSMAEKKGFEVIVHDRSVANKEKKIDTSIVTDIVSDSYELMNPDSDEITLVAGDKDYVPTIERLRKRGFEFHVVFWEHAARELKDAASKFISLNPYLDFLRLK